MACDPLESTLVLEAPPRVRARTESMHRLSKRDLARGTEAYPVEEHARYERPVRREDCLPGGMNAERPCPWVSCPWHLALDVNEDTGSVKHNFPDVAVWEMAETCVLDVADRGHTTLEEIGEIVNLTRERIRQIETRGLARLKEACEELGIDADVTPDPEPAPAVRVRRSIPATPADVTSRITIPGGRPWGGDHGRFFLPVVRGGR